MLDARGLTKRYGGVAALQDVSLAVQPGEIIGLIGENGAGKSTLIKVLSGLVQPDGGAMTWDGRPYSPRSPKAAERMGLGVIHQERHILENLTIADNIHLGREVCVGPFLNSGSMREEARRALALMNLHLDPDTLGADLSNADRQLVEIVRALALEARLIIMDEPTSSLSSSEADGLLEVVKSLKAKGVAVIYVTHRLGEVKEIADRVVGLRDGRSAGGLAREEISVDAMVSLMVGRHLTASKARPHKAGEPRLVVKDLVTSRNPGASISFDVKAGEIVGVAGLVGSGRTEAVRAIYGVEQPLSGSVAIDGQPLKKGDPSDAIDKGVLLVPEDRKGLGVILDLSVERNITLPRPPRLGGPLVSSTESQVLAERQKAALNIKCASVEAPVSSMSGGNQQKVALAKWLALSSKCLILDEPTCGIDVGARAEIYGIMRGLADQGTALLMISSDMEEVMAQSDRILVFSQGRIAGELMREEASEEKIMKLAVAHG